MSPSNLISDGKVVVMHYTLRSDGDEVIDSSVGAEPMAYLHGADNIVPGLESALAGKSVGFTGKVVVAPEDGYGERDDVEPQAVPRAAFDRQLDLEPGMQFTAEGPNGEHMPIWVVAVEEDKVLVESQHPLAGATLHFEVEVLEVRDATQEELAHGHPHGPDGHHHH